MNSAYKGVKITRKPACNVLEQDVFNERVRIVFNLLKDILVKSFGPYGAPTIISDYPYYTATKDGYHIAQNISLDPHAGAVIDRVIYRMAMDICARLNYAVGDGTTTAIMATNYMFSSAEDLLREGKHSSRELLRIIKEVKQLIEENYKDEVHPVTGDNMESIMYQVALISSNDDKEIASMIADAYKIFKAPVLRCETSDSKTTYVDIVQGYRSKVRLGDEIYFTNQNKTAVLHNVNVLIFDHQVTLTTYADIIRPLYNYCNRLMDSGLMIIAPSYDEVALQIHIRKDIMDEFNRTKKTRLYIMSYPRMNATDKESIADLAMLLNTTIIDKTIEHQIIEDAASLRPDVTDAASHGEAGSVAYSMSVAWAINVTDRDDLPIQNPMLKSLRESGSNDYEWLYNRFGYHKPIIRLGFTEKVIAGLKESTFTLNHYSKDLYDKFLDMAKQKLDDLTKKFAELGTYTQEIQNAQYRYTSLLMKTAVIYVGGDSSLSTNMRKDSVEDAIRATESAYYHGYVLGGNISLLRAIRRAKFSTNDKNKLKVLNSISNAFRWVYSEVLLNYHRAVSGEITETTISGIDEIIDRCIESGSVYDPAGDYFTKDVINSARTDLEVLAATVDLLGILLSGNQVLVARYDHSCEEG